MLLNEFLRTFEALYLQFAQQRTFDYKVLSSPFSRKLSVLGKKILVVLFHS